MIAQELRLKNAIMYSGIVVTVEAIASEYVSVSGIKMNGYTPLKLSQIEPIPLTEEWLFKLGLKKTEKEYFEVRSNLYLFGIKEAVDISGDIYYHPEKYSWSMFGFAGRLYYVHQLQNLYFSLTGEELTIK